MRLLHRPVAPVAYPVREVVAAYPSADGWTSTGPEPTDLRAITPPPGAEWGYAKHGLTAAWWARGMLAAGCSSCLRGECVQRVTLLVGPRALVVVHAGRSDR